MDPAKIDLIYFAIRNNIYPGGIRPSIWGDKMLPVVTFQLFPTTYASWQFKKYGWPNSSHLTSEYEMSFTLTNVEILKRRSKSKAPCIEDWRKYDQDIETIFQDLMEVVGCRAPYQQPNKPLPLCQTKEKMKEMVSALIDDPMQNVSPSCDTLENLQYRYNELNYDNPYKGTEWFWIGIDMPDRFKEIIQTRAVDLHSLIGNCGGYIGLFIGKCIASSNWVSHTMGA